MSDVVLALDVGTRRIGVAVGEGTFAFPHSTIHRTNVRDDVAGIVALARERGARTIVVGDPLTMSGERGLGEREHRRVRRAPRARVRRRDRARRRAADDRGGAESAHRRGRVARQAQEGRRSARRRGDSRDVAGPQTAVNRAGRALLGIAIAIVVGVGVIVGAASVWFRDAVYVDRALPAQQTDVVIERGSTFAQVVAALRDEERAAAPARVPHPRAAAPRRRRRQGRRVPLPRPPDERRHPQAARARRAVRGVGDDPRGLHRARDRAGARRAARSATRARTSASSCAAAGSRSAGSRTPNLEGYLFPSTYLLPTDDSPAQIARVLVGPVPPGAAARRGGARAGAAPDGPRGRDDRLADRARGEGRRRAAARSRR